MVPEKDFNFTWLLLFLSENLVSSVIHDFLSLTVAYRKGVLLPYRLLQNRLLEDLLIEECRIINKKFFLPNITMLRSFKPSPAMNETHSVLHRKGLQDSDSKFDTINSVYKFKNVAVRTECIQDK